MLADHAHQTQRGSDRRRQLLAGSIPLWSKLLIYQIMALHEHLECCAHVEVAHGLEALFQGLSGGQMFKRVYEQPT